jgi:hypothetical protein
MILEELADHLVAEGLAVLGTDLFLHVMPDKPDACASLINYSGDEPDYVQEERKVDVENPRVQLAVRSKQPQVCRERAEVLYQSLMQIRNQTFTGTRILWVRPVDSPTMAGRDENGRYLTTVNFRITKELSNV